MMLKEVRKMPFAKGGVCISHDGQTMIAMSGQTTRVIRMSDDAELAAFRDLKYAYRAAFSPDGETIAVKSNEPKLGFYSLKTLQPIGKVTIRRNNEPQDQGFCFSPDGSSFYNIEYTPELLTRLVRYDAKTLEETGVFFNDRLDVFNTILWVPEKHRYLLSGFTRARRMGYANRHFVLWLSEELAACEQIPLDADIFNFQYLAERDEFIVGDIRKLFRFDAQGNFLGNFFDCPKKNMFYGLSLSYAGKYLFCALSDGFIVFSTADFLPMYRHTTEWPILSFTTTPDDKYVYVTGFSNCTLFEICPDT